MTSRCPNVRVHSPRHRLMLPSQCKSRIHEDAPEFQGRVNERPEFIPGDPPSQVLKSKDETDIPAIARITDGEDVPTLRGRRTQETFVVWIAAHDPVERHDLCWGHVARNVHEITLQDVQSCPGTSFLRFRTCRVEIRGRRVDECRRRDDILREQFVCDDADASSDVQKGRAVGLEAGNGFDNGGGRDIGAVTPVPLTILFGNLMTELPVCRATMCTRHDDVRVDVGEDADAVVGAWVVPCTPRADRL